MPHARLSEDAALKIIREGALRPEKDLLTDLVALADLSDADRARIVAAGADLVGRIRTSGSPGLMEVFLAEYGLSTAEGLALMSLAEALLRVPDAATRDLLIADKIVPADWAAHAGGSRSRLVNGATRGLALTQAVLDRAGEAGGGLLRRAVRRLGEPVIRQAVARAMKEMGRQFVLGETITQAMERAAPHEARGITWSYDMLGEAARTEADALRYHLAYAGAITAIAKAATSGDIRSNPGISIKLSALHPRYEIASRDRVMAELVPRVRTLAGLAAAAGIGLNVDAEEADRLALSLEVIEAALADPALAGWDGFGVVVQAYGRRAGAVIDWLHALAKRLDRRIMVRLVKGAYWDAEIKRAQVLGLDDFPVFTRKVATDVSYIANARRLLGMTDRIYPQFAGHNAHTVCAILDLARTMGVPAAAWEFQRLHGMGERLHELVRADHGTACRVYAPVGPHRDLLAYLVRRLLENGANSSFVNQVVDEDIPPALVAACPFDALPAAMASAGLATGAGLFGDRVNSRGFDLNDDGVLARIDAARAPFMTTTFQAVPLLAARDAAPDAVREVSNPATGAIVGQVRDASLADVATALDAAGRWDAPAAERAAVLRRAADLIEADFGAMFALLIREAGKTLADAVAELREAVDFLRYYADGTQDLVTPARGIFVAISPWNFPLAIFAGQVTAALAAGNGVLAKPAEQTPLIAARAVGLLHQAGVPRHALQLLPGAGAVVGAALTRDARIDGVAFTGSTATAQGIRRSLADHAPQAVLIAETGGLNAMVVDSTALAEQAVRDIIISSFQSAGQRCSALRCLHVQSDIETDLLHMLRGAMDQLALGDPADLATDIGPVIDAQARLRIADHVDKARRDGLLIRQMDLPDHLAGQGHFVAPAIIRLRSIRDMGQEIFGPVLHVVSFEAETLPAVIDAINATGYGLTFGLHTRIESRVRDISGRVKAGNIYINRNQIGAIVGSQPFGGEGLSGTGPKAGGPHYLSRFVQGMPFDVAAGEWTVVQDAGALQRAIDAVVLPSDPVDVRLMPGPTGETNRLSSFARGVILCMGPGAASAQAQAHAVRAAGGVAVAIDGELPPAALTDLRSIAGVVSDEGDPARIRALQQALAARAGAIVPLIRERPDGTWGLIERHVCIDTTAAGGNAHLLAEVSGTSSPGA